MSWMFCICQFMMYFLSFNLIFKHLLFQSESYTASCREAHLQDSWFLMWAIVVSLGSTQRPLLSSAGHWCLHQSTSWEIFSSLLLSLLRGMWISKHMICFQNPRWEVFWAERSQVSKSLSKDLYVRVTLTKKKLLLAFKVCMGSSTEIR